VESSNLREKVNNLPQLPGSYIFKDSSGKVMYVGKAKNLRSRVKSYFSVDIPSNFKTAELVKRINDLDFIQVDSEFEAIILEAELIKKYRPKYNIVLKDDKSKIYIVIRKEKVDINGRLIDLPRVITARKPELLDSDIVFGPFPNNTVVKYILGTLRKIFPFRDCSVSKFTKYKKINSPCLYGHIGLCTGPCFKNSPNEIALYKQNISRIKKILLGNISSFISKTEKQMGKYSKEEEFEKALVCRDTLQKFYYVQKTFRDAGDYIDNPYLIDDLSKKAIEEISGFLPFLKTPPKRIECYDISNISGKESVGSMVVAIDGKIDKSEYRKFKIKLKNKPDDFGMMYEVLYRRLKSGIKNKSLPDLIIVDGGKPQVSSGMEVLKELDIEIPLIGIAEKNETLVYKDDGIFVEDNHPKDSYGMKLIISLRDEAHRFAQSYHHTLMKKNITG